MSQIRFGFQMYNREQIPQEQFQRVKPKQIPVQRVQRKIEIPQLQLAQEAMRSKIVRMTLEQTFDERDTLNQAVARIVNETAKAWSIARFEPRKKDVKRKQLTELYVKENFTEDREEWQKEVYTDQDETKEVQENRIEYFKKKGEQQFTKEGRSAEITVDLMLQARAKMSNNKVNGPEDAIVSEMIKHLPLGTICTTTKCFQERLWVRWNLQIRGRS